MKFILLVASHIFNCDVRILVLSSLIEIILLKV